MSITVICSVYNAEQFLPQYLNSINEQLLEKFDICFVDANSTDNSVKIIENFEFRNGIQTYLCKFPERIPIYEAWNIAIDASSTSHVININTDDKLLSGGLLIYDKYSQKYPEIDIFYGTSLIFSDIYHTKLITIHNWPEYSHELLLQFCFCGPFPLLKRQSIINAGYFNPKYDISGDYEMWLRMSKLGYKFKKVYDIVGSYYFNQQSASRAPDKLKEAQRQDIEIQNKYK